MELFAILLFMNFVHLPQAESQGKTFALTALTQGKANSFPRAFIPSSLPPLAEFTLCHWFRPLAVSQNHVIFNYVTAQHADGIQSYIVRDSREVHVNIRSTGYDTDTSFALNLTKWMHICYTFSSYTGSINFYLNGQLVKMVIDLHNNKSVDGGGDLHLLAHQTNEGSNTFYSTSNAEGEIAEVHLWDTVRCSSQIKKMAECSSNLVGNILNWKNIKMELFDGIGIRPVKDICEEEKEECNVEITPQ